MPVLTAIGLMSGTSLDGIDAALLRSDGEAMLEVGPALTLPYEPAFRQRLRAILGAPAGADIAGVEREMTLLHAQAVARLLAEAEIAADQIDLIGFHGHTILHQPAQGRPGEGRTRQIGDGALLARETGIAVVTDFRSADVAAGGEGAPLVPVFHAALTTEIPRPVAILNLGGVGNVTWIGPEGGLLAFDTGPGNALLDDWVQRHSDQLYDESGRLARAGTPDMVRIDTVLEGPYFARRPPKSLDRDDFSADLAEGLGPEDGAATLTALTIACVVKSAAWFPEPAALWVVTGGGRHNTLMMEGLAAGLGVPIRSMEDIGWDGDAVEAQAFAYLAIRQQAGLPISFPGTTGVLQPMTGGILHQPA
ncbi:MAG: anhydro-N-acetylmuramic acid kinase [Alphaproteobacteria bacterium]|nr:anhydro-N-acetylmuramic acid kinase [Alphaproteobacteria bacterium]MBU0796710.1 anhydro-N-acetylmuramic acid kinase [Alphaproteobacteria bacterium]MBU0888259.1 anhydro-N-acetylmuramic acid kinase [Alphaproteobacteria bacterium]MBU1811460.1 anhydro-N-acetylmuramic acid kinase [Alphaproteobacteria bacterium]